MEKSPLFSVITVCYNSAATIGPTLESVKSQTFTDYEYIVQDGRSTDGTVAMVEKSGIAGLELVSERDTGIYDAMNRALGRAQGVYVIFLNAGDAFHGADALARLAAVAEREDRPGIIYGQTILVDGKRKYVGPRHLTAPKDLQLDDFSRGMVVCHQAFVPLRRITGLYNADYRFSADYEWCIKCLQHSRHNIYVGDEPLIEYLKEGTTTRNRRRSLIERWQIMAMYFGLWTTLCRHASFVARAIKRRSL
ncbi:MAG: glycosyltransferase [Muribaculaceae bacterium]|nr:glycosyltransferase [Muribaculaceae bacterium]